MADALAACLKESDAAARATSGGATPQHAPVRRLRRGERPELNG
jgi:hypothetical protein